MIKLGFQHKVSGNFMAIEITGSKDLKFSMNSRGMVQVATIEGLKLSPAGIVKQFPDLKDKSIGEMRKEAIKRLKKKIKSYESNKEIVDYLKKDLAKHGWELKMTQRAGFRTRKGGG